MIRTLPVDLRRFVWSVGHATWLLGMPITCLVEDLEGAAEAGQTELARNVARTLGEECLVVVDLVVHFSRPIPEPGFRVSAALARLADHDLCARALTLICGAGNDDATTLCERGQELVAALRKLVGDVPNVLTPEGYFPAMSMAGEWLAMFDTVGEQGFLPEIWRAQDAEG